MKKRSKKIQVRIPDSIYEEMLNDLRRSHDFAQERVGFLFTRTKSLSNGNFLIIATEYIPVDDIDYIVDKSVGARINSAAIRKAMQHNLDSNCGCFHVHLHDHSGMPFPSFTDSNGLPAVVHSLSNISSKQANGFLILSADSFYTEIKLPNETRFIGATIVSIVGHSFKIHFSNPSNYSSKVYDRQTFLGKNAQYIFENIKVGIIGYGGGGSHIGQQLAHIGVRNINIFDDDTIEETNLNRLVGAWFNDVSKPVLKTSVAKRTIKKILPSAIVKTFNTKWQMNPEFLQECNIIFGCVDSYTERHQLESECRRYLIPLIDIGMDVHKVENFSMSGQIILSLPGMTCMQCFGYITEKKLSIEAAKYGKVGGRPQVIWPNGVLASTAIGIFVNLVSNWAKSKDKLVYLSYNGNTGTLVDHIRKMHVECSCQHYKLKDIGPVQYEKI